METTLDEVEPRHKGAACQGLPNQEQQHLRQEPVMGLVSGRASLLSDQWTLRCGYSGPSWDSNMARPVCKWYCGNTGVQSRNL